MSGLARKVGVLTIALVGTLGLVHAEQMTAPSGRRVQLLTTIPADALTLTNWYRQNVYEPNGATIGQIDDVLVSRAGRVDALIVSVGGFLGIGEKSVAVPFDAVTTAMQDGRMRLTMDATKDQLQAAPAVKYDRSRTTWVFAGLH